jgi:hypothetical protein
MRRRPPLPAHALAESPAQRDFPLAAPFLAALRGRSYLAVSLAVMAAACSRPPAPLAPSGGYAPLSAEAFAAVAARTVPSAAQLLQVRWGYDDGDRQATGRGAVRLAPPDTLRLDVGVPVVGRATLVLAGDSSWAQPDEVVAELPQSRAVLWALFGIIPRPERGTRIETGETPDRRLFRLTASDGLITLLECRADTLLRATELKGDRIVGRLALTRDAAGALVRAEATDVEHGVRFVVVVVHRETTGAFPDEIWRRP